MKESKKKYLNIKEGAITYAQMKAEALRDPEFRKEYEARRPEFELKCALIDARIKGELTQAEIAERAGTTQSAIARFESGGTSPTLAFMQRLAEALGSRLEVRLVKVN